MTFWAERKAGGQMLLGNPIKATLSYDEDAPADLLEAVFPADKMWDELSQVFVYQEGRAIFCGVVDEQNARWTSSGLTIEIVSRSMEALLLDNEAMPVTIGAPSLERVARELLSPLGLYEVIGDKTQKPGRFTIEKGESCWSALERFCQGYLGTVPYVDAEGVVHCEGIPEKSWQPEEITDAEVSLLPYKRLSAVWQQSCQGSYDTPFRDKEAPQTRVRYVSMENAKDPRLLLEESRRDSVEITAKCKGAWWPPRGAKVTLTLPHGKTYYSCPVASASCVCDESGRYTRLVLKGGET